MKLDSLLAQIGKTSAQKIPPVEKWNPELSGDMPMLIKADGSWWHEGEQIKRQELVNIFASILKQENDEYFLVTPVEKWRIQVEDRPLLITLISQQDNEIHALTSTADAFVLGEQCPLKMSLLNDVLLPEVRVRHDLWARLSRNAWYELLQYTETNSQGEVVVRSQESAFVLTE